MLYSVNLITDLHYFLLSPVMPCLLCVSSPNFSTINDPFQILGKKWEGSSPFTWWHMVCLNLPSFYDYLVKPQL